MGDGPDKRLGYLIKASKKKVFENIGNIFK